MGESGRGPMMAPLNVERGDQERWRHFDSSVNAVSFGFVATAILISMFLIMAIFERFLRPQSSIFGSFTDGRGGGGDGSRRRSETADLEARNQGAVGKLECPSPKVKIPLVMWKAFEDLCSVLNTRNGRLQENWECGSRRAR